MTLSSAPTAAADNAETPYAAEVVEPASLNWDRLVTPFLDGCLEQSAAYMAPRWGMDRLCGLLLREVPANEIAAAALAVIFTLPVLSAGLAYVKFGPLWRANSLADVAVLRAMLQALKNEFAIHRRLLLRIMPPAEADGADIWSKELERAGFTRSSVPDDDKRYLVNLTLSEAEQRRSLGAKWRSNLVKSQAGPLTFREVEVASGLPDFMTLYRAMHDRKRFVDRHKVHHLGDFAAALTPDFGLRLFMAYENDTPLAGTILAGNGDRLFVPYSATSDRGIALRAGYALRWWVIGRLRGSHHRWLDLGGVEGDQGLRRYKEGNVGKRGCIATLPGEYDFCVSKVSAAATSAIDLMRAAMNALPAGPGKAGNRP